MSRTALAILSTVLAALFAVTAYCASDVASKDSKATLSKSEQEPYTLEPWDFQDPAKFKSLLKEREDIQLKMHNVRVKLINEDPDLAKLHKQIMALHKELAIQLDSKKDMRKLSDKLRELDADFDKLPRKDSK